MENKYYTPSIEEFHVGFSYELRQADKWYPTIFLANECLCDFVNTDGYRVKYLDKEDIESLGFRDNCVENMVPREGVPSHTYFYLVEKQSENEVVLLDLIFYPNSKQVTLVRQVRAGGKIKENDIFKGVIKNKSELRKLMEQINIT